MYNKKNQEHSMDGSMSSDSSKEKSNKFITKQYQYHIQMNVHYLTSISEATIQVHSNNKSIAHMDSMASDRSENSTSNTWIFLIL